jgi:hypothetical protein
MNVHDRAQLHTTDTSCNRELVKELVLLFGDSEEPKVVHCLLKTSLLFTYSQRNTGRNKSFYEIVRF